MKDVNSNTEHSVLSYDEWFAAHKAHFEKEKAYSKYREQLASERRALPWLKIDKNYVFETEIGSQSLSELFNGRSQMIVYHFMLAPHDGHRCTGCSFLADHIDATDMHVRHHDVSFVVVSRAPLFEILPYKKRMGWRFNWVSTAGNDFNYDFQVSFTPEQIASGHVMFNYHDGSVGGPDRGGVSIFFKNAEGEIFHTFASRGRGGENVIGTYGYLDMLPKGRNENGPHGNLADWVKLHYEYVDDPKVSQSCCS
jgi:predicted dithiol-disulfide oxidoreductase (DUF899 family)